MDFSEEVSCVHYANVPPLSHGLMAMDWLFLGFSTCGVDGDEFLFNGYEEID